MAPARLPVGATRALRARQIRAWADHLQNADIKGPRHLTDQSRQLYRQQQRADAFQRHLDETIRQTNPDWFPNPNEET